MNFQSKCNFYKNKNEPPSLTEIQKALVSNVSSVRASALATISAQPNPDAVVGNSTAAELLFAFCADGDARVRATALNCLCNWAQYEKHKLHPNTNKRKFECISDNWQRVYTIACYLITEDDSKVRQICLRAIHLIGLRFAHHDAPLEAIKSSGGSIENASLDIQQNTRKSTPWRKLSTLADDAFSRVCDRLQDPSRHVREMAAGLIADLAKFVSDDSLMITLEKTVMTDRQVKRTAIDRSGGHDKMSLWGPVTGGSTGRTPQHGRQQGTTFQTPQPPTISVDSISLFSIGALGALINGLEDEYHEVRCATLATVTKIAAQNARFASLCQDILVDMLTDDIPAVRLRAVNALQTVGDQVPILNDQVAIVTSALAEDCLVIRQRIHNLLSRCRLVSPPCLISLLDGLLANLKLYPEDRDSIWRCIALVGQRHPTFVEVCVACLLRTHPWLTDPDPNREDPSYITVLLLVLNATTGAPGIVAHFPRHLTTSYAYLRDLVPDLLPRGTTTMHFPLACRPSTNLCLPAPKHPRLEGSSGSVGESEFTPIRFLESTVGLIRRLLCECIDSVRRLLPLEGHGVMETDDDSRPPQEPIYQLRRRLGHLQSVLRRELSICQRSLLPLCDLPAWLDCLGTALHCFLSAVHESFEGVSEENIQRLLRQALRLSLKAQHVFLGLTLSETDAIQSFRELLTHQKVPTLLLDSAEDLRVLTSLVEVCFQVGGSHQLVSGTGAAAAAARTADQLTRVVKPRVEFLQPRAWGGGASSSCRQGSAAIPEVRFTAILATAAIRIRALLHGFTLQQARDRVRVLYRRPDTTMVSPGSAKTRQQSWRPPPSSWKTVHEGSSSDKLSLPIAKTNQMPCLELQTTLELTASCWSEAATLEIGLGVSIPLATSEDGESAVISLLPPGVLARVKLHPCDPQHRW